MNNLPRKFNPKELNEFLIKNLDQTCLIDVRESYELDIASFSFPVIHLPLSEVSRWSEKLPNSLLNSNYIVIICHRGVRSWNFGIWLLENKFHKNVWNLEGGIDLWSLEVDSSISRY
tara:strand:- start:96 stop:446 length:351 start_codon:yes stop_codon:yes gene_type:complete